MVLPSMLDFWLVFWWLLSSLPVGVAGLKLRSSALKDGHAVWSNIVYYDQMALLFHSVDLSKSGDWLVDVLQTKPIPMHTVYQYGCEARKKSCLKEIWQFTKDPAKLKVLLDPSCLLECEMLFEFQTPSDFAEYPFALFHHSSFTPVSADSEATRKIVRVEMGKIRRQPLSELPSCKWISNVCTKFFSLSSFESSPLGIDQVAYFDGDPVEGFDWVFSRLHPLCIINAIERSQRSKVALYKAIISAKSIGFLSRSYLDFDAVTPRCHHRQISRWARLTVRLCQLVLLIQPKDLKLASNPDFLHSFLEKVDMKYLHLFEEMSAEIDRQRHDKSLYEPIRQLTRLMNRVATTIMIPSGEPKFDSCGPLDHELILRYCLMGLEAESVAGWRIHWIISVFVVLKQVGLPCYAMLSKYLIDPIGMAWPLDLHMLSLITAADASPTHSDLSDLLVAALSKSSEFPKMLLDQFQDYLSFVVITEGPSRPHKLIHSIPLDIRLSYLRESCGLITDPIDMNSFRTTLELQIFGHREARKLGKVSAYLTVFFDFLMKQGHLYKPDHDQQYYWVIPDSNDIMQTLGALLALAIVFDHRLPIPLSPVQLELFTGHAMLDLKELSDGVISVHNFLDKYFSREPITHIQSKVNGAIERFINIIPMSAILTPKETVHLLNFGQ